MASVNKTGNGLIDMIELEVDVINRRMGLAVLSDGQEVPIVNWLNEFGECAPQEAFSCTCGPDFDCKWYAVDLSQFTGVVLQ
jgi:hypothetical protein